MQVVDALQELPAQSGCCQLRDGSMSHNMVFDRTASAKLHAKPGIHAPFKQLCGTDHAAMVECQQQVILIAQLPQRLWVIRVHVLSRKRLPVQTPSNLVDGSHGSYSKKLIHVEAPFIHAQVTECWRSWFVAYEATGAETAN
jgi:hypothetical protein